MQAQALARSADYRFDTLPAFVGRELGVSDWLQIDQRCIDAFAECTGDRQWIHVDPERAARESPFGGTVAHGYLLVSLLARFQIAIGVIPPDASSAVNCGLDKLRFLAPVRAGARVRGRVRLAAVEERGPGRRLVTLHNTVDIEGARRPALTAETTALLFGPARAPGASQGAEPAAP